MAFFKEIAEPLISRGVPVVPLGPKSKAAFLSGWQNLATTDPKQIEEWDKQYPESNAGSVAKGEIGKYWFWEIDDPALPAKIESETGQQLPKTFRVRSSPGRGHFYFRHTPASLAMGNITQGYVKDRNFSVRVNNEYVVAPGSWHPTSGRQYEIVSTHDIVEAPEWLIEWIIRQRVDSGAQGYKPDLRLDSTAPIPRGAHDVTLTGIAGGLRRIGAEEEAIYNLIVESCEKRCVDYGSDYKEMCRKIAHSVCNYAAGTPYNAYIGSQQNQIVTALAPEPSIPEEELEEQPVIETFTHPKFPMWVMNGTSIYEGLVKPYCDINQRYEEFMFMPAFVLLLNYIGTKVNVYMKSIIPSLFLVIIGKRGETMKSASVQDAIMYFNKMGLCEHAGPNIKNAEGKSLIWTAGSPEGLGIDAQRTNCKNIVLYYDELSLLTSKAGIDSSSLGSTLLGLYESSKFSNRIKGGKESYSIDPGTYCASLITCSTEKNFLPNWSKMSGSSTGLDDRTFFLFQREQFKEPMPQTVPSVLEGAKRTLELINQAVKQATFRITDSSPLAHEMKRKTIDNREGIRVEKFALGFAVDLGKDEIDEECIERALALVKYEKDVKKYLQPFEAVTMQGSLQLELITILQKNAGRYSIRDVRRIMHPERLGTDLWIRAVEGLVKTGYMKVEGKGSKSDPKTFVLLRSPERDDD